MYIICEAINISSCHALWADREVGLYALEVKWSKLHGLLLVISTLLCLLF
jgi:hypothetical protein